MFPPRWCTNPRTVPSPGRSNVVKSVLQLGVGIVKSLKTGTASQLPSMHKLKVSVELNASWSSFLSTESLNERHNVILVIYCWRDH